MPPVRSQNVLQRFSAKLAILSVFWPALLFVVAVLLLFVHVSQGRDVVRITLESPLRILLAMAGTLFAAYVSWYSSRVIGFTRLDVLGRAKKWGDLFPRFLGFSCFTAVALAFVPVQAAFWSWGVWLLFWVGGRQWYRMLERLAERIEERVLRKRDQKLTDADRKRRVARALPWIAGVIILGALLPVMVSQWWMVVAGCLLMQGGFMVLVHGRKNWSAVFAAPAWMLRLPVVPRVVGWLMRQRSPDRGLPMMAPNELYYFVFFNLFAGVMFGVFVGANYSVPWAIWLGPMPIALLGLAMLLGFTNLLRFVQAALRVNLFFFGLVLVVVLGQFWDPHAVRTQVLPQARPERPTVQVRMERWLAARRSTIEALPAGERYPVFLVMSDGGASRSGYWVSSVLGRLQRGTDGEFSKHLFSLSGASGGSVGNAAFMALLAEPGARAGIDTLGNAVLKQDMLSHPMANLLGADVLHTVFPFITGRDRAAALENGLMHAGAVVQRDLFRRPFDHLVNDSLPVFMINATRMQDAQAGVVANVLIDPGTFNQRLDIIGRLPGDTTITLAAAAMLGARFPYISPAGTLPGKVGAAISMDQYVDGGYFDNSGAGVTHEMLVALAARFRDDSLFNKLEFHVLHITNGIRADTVVHTSTLPLLNDLAAPIITMAGAYGSQTDINNLRLRRYMQGLPHGHYHTIDVYTDAELAPGEELSMNWVISDAHRAAMDRSAARNKEVGKVLRILQGARAAIDP